MNDNNNKREVQPLLKQTKVCSKCRRNLPLDRFGIDGKKIIKSICKSCCSTYLTMKKGNMSEDDIITIERLYKEPLPIRILDVKQAEINPIAEDECFVELIDYKRAWISNYGRVLEHNGKKYVFKRIKTDYSGEKICTLQENIYNGEKWVFQKKTIEVWRLVVYAFIVNFDIVGNTHCWHRGNNKHDNYYKNIYPISEKQYTAILERYTNGETDTEKMIFDIINNIAYKENDWYANKWKRTTFGIGYLGCNNPSASDKDIYVKWANMMQRCYSEEVHKNKSYYIPCTADIEWLNFSNYREWHKKNSMGDRKVDLDKDVLIPGNTVYGSETCTLIPHFTNTIFESRGLDTNIVLNNDTGKYDVTMSILSTKKDVGAFDTHEEAQKGYIEYKQNYIRDFAEKCKGKVPYKTYIAMLNWKVEKNN